jgi:hypothetical protein
MPNGFRPALLFAAAVALPVAAEPSHPDELAALRSQGPAGLRTLLKEYDAMPPGPARDALAVDVDKVAGQRYATVSRLYWFTELAPAVAEAQREHRPILELRMLGRLDEDLSCANSRLFRATLYADAEVSTLLRDDFVLLWTSERPVPKVTIDFGDGRKIVRTTTGNSAHYILDENGAVLDVLPGLYAPSAFRTELQSSLAFAHSVRGKTGDGLAQAIAAYHTQLAARTHKQFKTIANAPYIAATHHLSTAAELDDAIARAQRATMSKAMIEVRDLKRIGLYPGAIPDDAPYWAAVGQRLYNIGDIAAFHEAGTHLESVPNVFTPPRVLDARSRALIAQLHDAVPTELVATPAQLAEVIARLEQHLVADSALDQLQLRPQISQFIASHHGRIDFETLNSWIYATVFNTPASDPWLGLMPRTDFSGLPGDGIESF